MTPERHRLKRSLLISFAERYGITALQFVSVMVLARLLTPTDIGLYSVGLAIIGIAHMLRDFGIGQYLMQEKDLTAAKTAAAFGLTMSFSFCLGLLVFLLAPYIANYYQEQSVKEVLNVVGLNFFIIPFGAMGPSLLRRSMSFGTLSKISIGSAVISTTVAVSLAFAGFGFMSMAWASVAGTAAGAVLGQYYIPKRYRVFPSLREAKAILSFGRHVVGANLAGIAYETLLNLVVGKVLGFAALGYLSRGQGYVKIYNSLFEKAINPVISAHLAMKHRVGTEVADSFCHTLDHITVFAWLCLGFLALMSFNLIRILYGDQWDTAVPIASFLCLLAFIGVPTQLTRRLLIATGHVKTNFRLTIAFVGLRIAVLFLVIDQGIIMLLLIYLFVGMLSIAVTYYVLNRLFSFESGRILRIIAKNLVVVAVSLTVPAYFWFTNTTNGEDVIVHFLIAAPCSFATWIGLIFITKHPLRDEVAAVLVLLRNKFKTTWIR